MNARVAHADADTGVGGSTAPTTAVSKSNSDKAETLATSIEPQAPSDEGTSDANTGKSTTPATSDKAKSTVISLRLLVSITILRLPIL